MRGNNAETKEVVTTIKDDRIVKEIPNYSMLMQDALIKAEKTMVVDKFAALVEIIKTDNTDDQKYERNRVAYSDALYQKDKADNSISDDTMAKLKVVLTDEEIDLVITRAVDEITFQEIGEQLGLNKQKVHRLYSKAIKKLREYYIESDFIAETDTYYCNSQYTGTLTGSLITDYYVRQMPCCELMDYLHERFGDTKTVCPGIHDKTFRSQLNCSKLQQFSNVPAGLTAEQCAKRYGLGKSTVEKHFKSGRLPGRKVKQGKTKAVWITTGDTVSQCNEMVFDTKIYAFDEDKYLWWEIEQIKNRILFAPSENYQPQRDINKELKLKSALIKKMKNVLQKAIEENFKIAA